VTTMIDDDGGSALRGSRRCGIRLAAVIAAACVAALLGAGSASAAATQTYALRGAEYRFSSTVGSFAGSAREGRSVGTFDAVVTHTVLAPNATITPGGSFSLITGDGRVSGSFTGGSITQLDGFTGCQDQHYAVRGDLSTTGSTTGRSGEFRSTLTHHRAQLGTHCVSYFASITGTATVPAPTPGAG
jgi:hypothetical protein